MKDIAIFGAGGFGREVACLIRLINEKEPTWNLIGFFDEGKEKGSENEYGTVLGGFKELNAWKNPLALVIAIGNPNSVKQVVSGIDNPVIDYPNIIAPTTIFLDEHNLHLGRGNIICSNCLFSCNIIIGNFNIFNGYITVGHDMSCENFNVFMPAVRISGEVMIGNENFFGVNATILQQVKIGNNTKIGANSLIIKKTKDGNTYICPPSYSL